MKVKEESEEAGLKLNTQNPKIMASGPQTSWQIDGETKEIVTDYFLGIQNHCRCAAMKLRCFLLGRKAITNLLPLLLLSRLSHVRLCATP